MYPVGEAFKAALRSSHVAVIRVDAWRSGALIISDLPILGGEVSMDATSGGVRSTLNLTLARDLDLWDTLAPVGTEIRPYRGLRFIDGSTEMCPLGVFGVDSQRFSYAVNGTLTLTAPDRYASVQRARFLQPATTTGNAVTEAIRLATEAVPVTVTNTTTSAATTRAGVWDRDRDAAIGDLVKSAAAELYFDREGLIVARNLPELTAVPVWNVGAGESGVMVGADRSRERARTYSVVVAMAEAIDGVAPFVPQVASDDDPTSPTYHLGPFGSVPMFYSSPLLTTAAQALAAAKSILARVSGMAAQITLESAVNPALDPGDTISVVLPGGTVEHHLIDAVNIPLDVGSAQKIGTRSTRPEGDVPA